jgi:iron complex outermembrane receptor protein
MFTFLRSRPAALLTLLVVITVMCVGAAAQNPAQLTIAVKDEGDLPLANAEVILSQPNIERTFKSGADGSAQISNLALGEWTLTVKAEGFSTAKRPVVVQGAPVSVTVMLQKPVLQLKINVEGKANEDAMRLDSTATGGTLLDVPVRELPATLNVVTQDLIQERGVANALDALELAPGIVTWTDSGFIPGIDARGFSSNDAGIQVMLDGVRHNTVPQSGRSMDAFMIDRVEILKGPASLLYGEGSVGSAVNYVMKKPKPELGFDTLLYYGSFGLSRVGLGANVPLRDDLTARLDLSYSNGGGYVQRTGNRMRTVNGQLRWSPLENLTIDAMGVVQQDTVGAYYGTPLSNSAWDPDGKYIQLSPTSYLDERMRFTNYNIQDELNKGHNNRGRIDAELALPAGWRLRNSFGVSTQRVDSRSYESYGFNNTTKRVTVGGYFLIKRDDIVVSEQLDVRKSFSVLGRVISFTAGGAISDNNQHRWGSPSGAPTFTVEPINPAPLVDPGLPYARTRDVYTVTKNLFLEGNIRLTKKLILTGGGRIERISNHRFDEATRLDTYKIFRPKTGRFGLVYTLFENVNLYVSNSRSVQPVTPLVSLASNQFTFSLQPARSWEGGVKATAFRGRLDTTLAVFSMNRKNMLTQTIVNDVRIQQQIGEQMSQGYEFSFVGRPHRMFTLNGDLSYTNAEYVDFNENLGTGIVSRAGNDVPHTPAVVTNFTPIVRVGPVTFSMTVRNVGARWRDRANTIRLAPYTTLSSNLSIVLPKGARLTLTARNLTDELYMGRSNSESVGRFAAPRNYSVQLTKTFLGDR